jgi:hypothetical protein
MILGKFMKGRDPHCFLYQIVLNLTYALGV